MHCVLRDCALQIVLDYVLISSHVRVSVVPLAVEGMLFCWGRGRNGRLGTGNTDNVTSPQHIPLPEERQVCVRCHSSHRNVLSLQSCAHLI